MFSTGDEVFLIHTGDFGIVLAQYDEDTLLIEVDGDEIPIYLDHLKPAAEGRKKLDAEHEAALKVTRDQEEVYRLQRANMKQDVAEAEAKKQVEEQQKFETKQRKLEEKARKKQEAAKRLSDAVRAGKSPAAKASREPTNLSEGKEFQKQAGQNLQISESGMPKNGILKKGMHLYFSWQVDAAGNAAPANSEGVTHFELWLANQTDADFLFDYSPSFGGVKAASIKGRMEAGKFEALGNFELDALNDKPAFKLECWLQSASTNSFQQKHFSCELKIKASTFMRQLAKASAAGQADLVYTFFEKIPEKNNSLKDEFASKAKADGKKWKFKGAGKMGGGRKHLAGEEPNQQQWHKAALSASGGVTFPGEIDLHIEKLLPKDRKVKHGEQLSIQLKHCRDYLQQAIRNEQKRVYLIHGLGTGKLRVEINAILLGMPEVKRFNNDHHPKYGFGATEVIFEGWDSKEKKRQTGDKK